MLFLSFFQHTSYPPPHKHNQDVNIKRFSRQCLIPGLLRLPTFVIFLFFVFSRWWVLLEHSFSYFIFDPPNHPTNALCTHSIRPTIIFSTHTVPCWSDSRHNRTIKEARGIPPFQVSFLHAVSCLSHLPCSAAVINHHSSRL